MAYENGISNVEVPTAFIESLQADFKNLSVESKKKYPAIKEVNSFNNQRNFIYK
jgi:hypothetical protein